MESFQWHLAYLKFILWAAKTGPLFLPEVIRFDYIHHEYKTCKMLIQNLQNGFHAGPCSSSHVNNHGETTFSCFLAEQRHKKLFILRPYLRMTTINLCNELTMV